MTKNHHIQVLLSELEKISASEEEIRKFFTEIKFVLKNLESRNHNKSGIVFFF